MLRELRREVHGLRHRRAVLVVAIVTIVLLAQLALFTWLAVVRKDVEVRVVHDTRLVHDIVQVPLAISVEHVVEIPAEGRACPLPRHDAPLVAPGPLPEHLYHVTSLRPSPTNAGWIAAWNEYEVFISTDAGASWKRRFDGDGLVRDVSFDCFGRALVVRGDRLGIYDGTEHWTRLRELALADGEHTTAYAAILGGGPDIAIVGNAPHGMTDMDWTWQSRIIISHDAGDTWLVRDLVSDWEGNRVIGRQHEDGTIRGMIPETDCAGDSPWIFTVDPSGNVRGDYDTHGDTNLGIYDDLVVTAQSFELPPNEKSLEILEGPYPILASETTLYRLAKGKLTKLPWKLPEERSAMITDAAGRVWSIVCGQVTIATRHDAPVCDCDGP